jgi:hypothetical protein
VSGLSKPEDFLRYDDPVERLALEFVRDVEAYLARVVRFQEWCEQEGRA